MTVDLTGIACSIIAGVFSILAIVLPMLISSRIKDAQAAATLTVAVKNSLGAMQQASTEAALALGPHCSIRGVPDSLAPGVQYVLDHAGVEAERFGISPAAIADKVVAQIGLAQIATNQAVAASASPKVPDPLGPLTLTSPKT